MIAGWLERADVEAFKKIARAEKCTATDLLTVLIREEIKRKTKTTKTKGVARGNGNGHS